MKNQCEKEMCTLFESTFVKELGRYFVEEEDEKTHFGPRPSNLFLEIEDDGKNEEDH
jgi:hypothetical protein